MNKQLPKDWKWVKLGEVCDITMGQSPTSDTYTDENTYLPFYQGKTDFTDLYPIPRKYCKKPKKIAEPNDILLSVRAPVGSTNIANEKCCIGRGLSSLRFENYKFGFYFLRSIEQYLDSKGTGTTFKSISGENIRETPFPLPPLPIQNLIVAKIEELFSELDKGIENLRTAQQQLKIYRQSVLKWVFEGTYKSTIGELYDFTGGGTPSKQIPEYWDGAIPWASVKDIKGDFLLQTQDKISQTGLENSSANIADQNDVILITRISPGKAIITNISTAINQDLKIVKPKFKTTSKYIFYVFKSIERECVKKSSGTTVLGINLVSLKEIEVPSMNFEEQNLIVQKIESRLSVVDTIDEDIKQSLQQAEALRQSILKKAFEGELV